MMQIQRPEPCKFYPSNFTTGFVSVIWRTASILSPGKSRRFLLDPWCCSMLWWNLSSVWLGPPATTPIFAGLNSLESDVYGERTATGWTRFKAPEINDRSVFVTLFAGNPWLSQANHIFQRLNITSSHEDYAFIEQIHLELSVPAPSKPHPEGYLFACPLEHLKSGGGFFAWPPCPWFWSLDSSGIPRLTPETAQSLGFPVVKQSVQVSCRRWDTSVYEGLSKFHASKGFNPYSQDLAKHLGVPVMEVAGDRETLHAHVDELPEEGAEDEMEDINVDNSHSSADMAKPPRTENRHRYW
ncbi:hypothetical protein FB45DRAFT_78665 [Roridomyces roridus]|uniref:Uncharacterized protein n=1 Tax=Roridomyces roridus TaxID=1738132 RepID=A0AAD7F8U3_9AGAR|nr:hypothetical protein FB45DRAFT_78665 [Roridomyces roridus]